MPGQVPSGSGMHLLGSGQPGFLGGMGQASQPGSSSQANPLLLGNMLQMQ